MNTDLLIGLFALGFGLYSIYARFYDPGKLGKLEPMKKQWGDSAGTAIHWLSYTIAPLVVGVVMLVRGLKG